VATFSVRPWSGDLIKIRTKMGRTALVTPDHPLVVGDGVDGENVVTKLAADLLLTDWLPIAQGFPLLDDCPLELEPSASVSRPAWNANSLPASLPGDLAFWRMIGLYLAEGHQHSTRPILRWSFSHRERELAQEVVAYWETQGVRASVRSTPTSLQAVVNSQAVARWFDELGLGRRSWEKAVPDQIWERPEAEKRALLGGLWDGDGSWSYVDGGPSVTFEYGTVSRRLADGMLRLLGDVGVVAALRVGRTSKSKHDTYWIRIAGADQLESCWWLLPPGEQELVFASLAQQTKRIAPTGYRRLSKNAAWVRVVACDPVPYEGPVYSLHVPGAETVVLSNGLVTRQCFPKDTRAMVHIADEHGYDFDLLRGVISVNDEQYERMADKVERMVGGSVEGCQVAAWGLTFKARTDDLRDSPAIEVLRRLRERGAATIRAYDPGAKPESPLLRDIEVVDDPYAVCEGADVLVVLTEWDEFRWLDFAKVAGLMHTPRIVDTRNLLEPAAVRRRGFVYDGLGRA
jgi:UDPglucose 6-dehydrogenase